MTTPTYAHIVLKMLGALPISGTPSAELPPAIAAATAEATCAPEWGIAECVPIWPLKKRGTLAGLTVGLGYFESGFLERIGASRCRKDECDAVKLPGGRVVHLARGYWQVHQTGLLTFDEWREARGSEAWPTFVQARLAIRVIVAAAGKCRHAEGEVGGAISAFATGGRCYWSGAPGRERIVRKLIAIADSEST